MTVIDVREIAKRKIDSGSLQPVLVVNYEQDETSGTLIAIDYVHHEVHEGITFHAERLETAVNNNVSLDVLLVTGAKECHAVFGPSAGGSCYVFLYEGTTTSNNGTALSLYNMRRSKSNVPASLAYYAPTVVALGPALVSRYLPGGTSNQTRVGGGVRTGTEWIQRANTRYLFRITNVSGSAIAIGSAVEFYEH